MNYVAAYALMGFATAMVSLAVMYKSRDGDDLALGDCALAAVCGINWPFTCTVGVMWLLLRAYTALRKQAP